jgi:hypothetical protein
MVFKVGERRGNKTIAGTATLEGRKDFADRIESELPAFLFYLLNDHRIPAEIVDSRFGVATWHHPDIIDALLEASPEGQLLALIDSVPFPFLLH